MTDLKREQIPALEAVNEQVYRRRCLLVSAVIALVIIADQTLKIWVKTHFYLGEALEITPWWELKFIENNGMAFGVELWSKLALTLLRIAAVGFFIWFIARIIRRDNLRTGFFVTAALITAGAAGNIFDCVFYGQIFNDPMPPGIAVAFPNGGGYAGWFEGRVVDMLYFPLFSWVWPEWMPGVGGTEFEFFQYIFNIADAAICVGVFLLILFYSKDASDAFNTLNFKPSDKKDGKSSRLK